MRYILRGHLAQSVELSAVNRSVIGSSPMVAATILAHWRSGLTHMPFTHAFMGSNPVWVTILIKWIELDVNPFFFAFSVKINDKLLHSM